MATYIKEYFDFKLLITFLALITIGLVSIYSSTADTPQYFTFYRQLAWSGVGLILLLIGMFIPLRELERTSYFVYFFSLIILALVLIVGQKVYGSKSWFGYGGFGIQPSEFVKITTIIAVSAFLGKSTTSITNLKDTLGVFGIVIAPVFLIMLQPDFGTALTYLGFFIPLIYWSGSSNTLIVAIISPIIIAILSLLGTTYFVIALILVGIGIILLKEDIFISAVLFGINVISGIMTQIIYNILPLYQQKRILTFLDPSADPLGAGYNIIQSKVAIGSGGLFGKGFMNGSQTRLSFIPKQWTDFIFCVTGEEFGFIGSIIILGLFAYLLYRGLWLASTTRNRFGSLLAMGITSLFAVHIIANIGMVIGLMPVIGIPLPFLSYGGSSLCSYMLMAGLMLNVYMNRKLY